MYYFAESVYEQARRFRFRFQHLCYLLPSNLCGFKRRIIEFTSSLTVCDAVACQRFTKGQERRSWNTGVGHLLGLGGDDWGLHQTGKDGWEDQILLHPREILDVGGGRGMKD